MHNTTSRKTHTYKQPNIFMNTYLFLIRAVFSSSSIKLTKFEDWTFKCPSSK